MEIDCWGPLVRLLVSAAPGIGPDGYAAALTQTRFHLDHFLDAGAGVLDAVRTGDGPDPVAQGAARRDGRGVAWALLGLAESAHCLRLSPETLAAALATVPGPPALDADSSAAAITAVALFKLADTLGDAGRTRHARARRIVAALVRERLDPSRPGVLTGTRYRTAPGIEEPVESIWGAFFLVQALALDQGLLGPHEI